MGTLDNLFENNRGWADSINRKDPDFFLNNSGSQHPEYLWIGCSDSRVPANDLIGLQPGELFVHRNIANLVVHTDLNCASAMQFAVEHLKVKHIIICGHYGCGGVRAALEGTELGITSNWVRHVRDVHDSHQAELSSLGVDAAHDRLCELNVIQQVNNVTQGIVARTAWDSGQELSVHGWIYGLKDGLVRDLEVSQSGSA